MTDSEYSVQREFERHEVTAYVDPNGSSANPQRIQNISLGGCCIHTPLYQEVGTRLELKIKFPAIDAQLEVEGEVVWVNTHPLGDVGVRFVNLDEEKRSRLEGYITKAQDPA